MRTFNSLENQEHSMGFFSEIDSSLFSNVERLNSLIWHSPTDITSYQGTVTKDNMKAFILFDVP